MSEPREVAAHRLEVKLLPTALLIAHMAIRHIGVDQCEPSALSGALQLHGNCGVWVGSGKFSRAPSLNDALSGYELDIGT